MESNIICTKPEFPGFIENWLTAENVREADYHLLWVGKQLAFIRIAAELLDNVGEKDILNATYHAVAGISSAKGVADSTASWLNQELALGYRVGNALTLAHEPFFYKVSAKLRHSEVPLRHLQRWAGVFDLQRTRRNMV